MQYKKMKSASKEVLVKGSDLEKLILKTSKIISDIVGGTLGPGGQPVLIERHEFDLPPIVTKDGVTVFRNLGFVDPTMQCILEAARDAAKKTADEAGDGPQPLWSKVLTPDGFIEMRDVKVGMEICGTNGTVQRVLGVFPKGKREIIKVTFEQGQVVECCEDHLWTVKLKNVVGNKVLTTKEIGATYNECACFVPTATGSFAAVSNIQKTGEYTEMQCIKVSNPDCLYITDDFIATHNTTTATILFESLVRLTHDFCKKYPRMSPQKVVRKLEKCLNNTILPEIQKLAIPAKNDENLLKSVAKVSANNESELADAVMECFRLVGDDGNVTIIETSGKTGYKIERIDGYVVGTGFDQCCNKYYPAFLNDPGQKVILRKPVFLLYFGTVSNIQDIFPLLKKVADEHGKKMLGEPTEYDHSNVVVVATGFSDNVLAAFANASKQPESINVYPLLVPLSPFTNGQKDFIDDLSAITGATVFDPITNVPTNGSLADLGPGIETFEANKNRTVLIGYAKGEIPNKSAFPGYDFYEDALLGRVTDLQTFLEAAGSVYESISIQERIGKLTGGIAKLYVVGSSNGELKERRDRAEDAICAVRGAIKHGCLPGGGWTFLKISNLLKNSNDPVIDEIMIPALITPVFRLLFNCGYNEDDARVILTPVLEGILSGKTIVYDAYEQKHGDPVELGVLDSASAVTEALKNSLSIASQLGTLGGTVVFSRDTELERSEASRAIDNLSVENNA